VTSNVLVTVVVCHDRPVVREGLRTLLDAEPDINVVGVTAQGAEAGELVRATRPNVIVTGLRLTDMSGIELMNELRETSVDFLPRLLVYATISDDALLSDVLRAGACAILSDDASREEMVLAIRVAASGKAMLGPGVAERMLSWYAEQGGEPAGVSSAAEDSGLTPREREILVLTAQGMSIEDISRALKIGVATVRTHIYRLRLKLQLRDRAQLVSFAFRSGLM
jgi:DNA-binding NarL/FixJ family response regulator